MSREALKYKWPCPLASPSRKQAWTRQGFLNRVRKEIRSAEAMKVDYGAASGSAGPWSTVMSSVYAESECLSFVDAILTSAGRVRGLGHLVRVSYFKKDGKD